MTEGMFELLSLSGRYLFTGLMLLIVLRSVRGALVDSRRAAKLRQLSPMTGLTGELVVLDGDEKARKGMRYAVIREGLIGSSRASDIRIRHSSVRRRHAYFQLSREGLRIQSHAGARIRDRKGRVRREIMLGDGGIVTIGRVRLLLVFSLPDAPIDPALLETEEATDPFALSKAEETPDPFTLPETSDETISPPAREAGPKRGMRPDAKPRRPRRKRPRVERPEGTSDAPETPEEKAEPPLDIDALFDTKEDA